MEVTGNWNAGRLVEGCNINLFRGGEGPFPLIYQFCPVAKSIQPSPILLNENSSFALPESAFVIENADQTGVGKLRKSIIFKFEGEKGSG